METLQIELIDPEVRKVLNELVANKRIRIQSRDEAKARFLEQVRAMRALNFEITEDEILAEVKSVRARKIVHESHSRHKRLDQFFADKSNVIYRGSVCLRSFDVAILE